MVSAWPQDYNRPGSTYDADLGRDCGRRIFDWPDASVNGATGGCSVVATPTKGATQTLQITPNNATCRVNIGTTGTPLAFSVPATARNFGFWAKSTASVPRSIEFLFTADNFSNFSRITCAIEPGDWRFYCFPRTAIGVAGGTGFPFGTTTDIQILRITNGASTGDRSALPTTAAETVYVGGVYMDMPSRPKFMITFDDYSDHLVTAQAFNIAGGDGVSQNHSYQSFVESYGWKLTFHVQAGNIYTRIGTGTGGTILTTDQIDSVYAAGHSIATQSWYCPQNIDVGGSVSGAGTRLLGPYGYGLTGGASFTCADTGLTVTPTNDYTRILEDQTLARDYLLGLGYDSAKYHYSFQQGGLDRYVLEACKLMGWATVRGILTVNNVQPPFGVPGGVHTTHSASIGYPITQPSSIQLDSAGVADATITAFVDGVIQTQGVGTSYAHNFSQSVSGPKAKVLCDYLKKKEQLGLIDIVSAEEYRIGLTRPALVAA